MKLKRVEKIERYTEVEKQWCCKELQESRITKLMEIDFESRTVSIDLTRYSDDGRYAHTYWTRFKYCPYCGTKFQFEELTKEK